jgi:hypothetical protein
MPPESPLVLAVLAGYVFIQRFQLSKLWAQSLDGWHLVYQSSIVGVILIVPARIVVLLLSKVGSQDVLRVSWHKLAGSISYLGTTALVFLAAPLLAYACNAAFGMYAICKHNGVRYLMKCCWRAIRTPRHWIRKIRILHNEISTAYALDLAISARGTALEQLLYNAAQRALSEKQMVCLTMADRKVYVGSVVRSPNLRVNDSFVSLAPLMSGYRTSEMLEIKFTYTYPSNASSALVLPLSDIRSARVFDVNIYYQQFQSVPLPS